MFDKETRQWGIANQPLFPALSAAMGAINVVAQQMSADGRITPRSREQLTLGCQELALALQGFDDAPPIPDPIAGVLFAKSIRSWRTFLDQSVTLETVDEFEVWADLADRAEKATDRAMNAIGVAVAS